MCEPRPRAGTARREKPATSHEPREASRQPRSYFSLSDSIPMLIA
jgi:hypothetical protein